MKALAMTGLVAMLGAGLPEAAGAQPTGPLAAQNVVSANPFGMLFELFNAELERRVSPTTTLGVGGSTATVETYDYDSQWNTTTREERYVNADVFVRYYPKGRALNGRSFGLKAGLTTVPNQGTFFGFGFDVNRSWMLNEHFYFGTGLGLKRLVGTDDADFDLKYIPTLRLNLGVGF
jgi:hypothetical protein